MPIIELKKILNELLHKRKKVFNLSYQDFGSWPSLIEEKRIQRSFINIFKYPHYHPNALGSAHARQAIAKYYQKQGQPLTAEQIIITSTQNHALSLVFKLFSLTKKPILLPAPRSPHVQEVINFVGAKAIDYHLDPENNWEIDLQEVEKQFKKGCAAMYLMSPHLPTGSVIPESTSHQLLKLAEQYQVPLITNECFSELVFDNQPYFSLADDQHKGLIITINTVANFLALPGAKLTWFTFHGKDKHVQDAMDNIEKLEDTFMTTNQFSMEILPEILQHSAKFQTRFFHRVESNARLTTKMFSKEPNFQLSPIQGGFTCLVRIPSLPDGKFVLHLIKKRQIYLHPGSYYNAPGKDYFMISFLQDPAKLKKNLQILIKEVNQIIKLAKESD